MKLGFKLGAGLIDQQGRPYDGPEPYVVLLLDGKRQDAFKDFSPTAATAALLERFLQQKDGSEVVIATIVDAVKLYNDMRFRREADRLKEQLGGVNARSPEGQALKKKMDAMLANVGEQLLKPKPIVGGSRGLGWGVTGYSSGEIPAARRSRSDFCLNLVGSWVFKLSAICSACAHASSNEWVEIIVVSR